MSYYFSTGIQVNKLLNNHNDVRSGDIYYSEDISKDDWETTKNKKNLKIIQIGKRLTDDRRYIVGKDLLTSKEIWNTIT